MSSQPFVAVTIKRTHHVLGVLSRAADPAGADITALAPENVQVRAPIVFPNPPVAPATPFELGVPAELLQAVNVTNSNDTQRRQVFGNPLGCIVADNGSAAPVATGAADPVFNFGAVVGGVISTFDLDIVSVAGADGVPFTVLIQQADPPNGDDPFLRITEGTVAAGGHTANAVQIRNAAGDNAPADPLPTGMDVHVLVSAAGKPLLLETITI
jgi:hypothetical protein